MTVPETEEDYFKQRNDQPEEYGTTILEPFTLIPIEQIERGDIKIGTAATKYMRSAAKGFYAAAVATSRTLTKQAPFATGQRKGEPRPDLDVTHIWVNGRTKGAAWFVAHFADGRFVEAEVWDTIGIEVEMRYDYTPTARQLARQKDEPESAHRRRVEAMTIKAMEDDALYNDGQTYTMTRRHIITSTEFENWLARYDQTLIPRKAAPPRKKAAE